MPLTRRAIFFGLLLLSASLLSRLYQLGGLPQGFHVDELDAGYVGRYILLHGSDLFGNAWPLTVNKFGDFRPAGIFYLTGASTFVFGITEFAVRFPAALAGALSVGAIAYLGYLLTRDRKIAWTAGVLLAVLPWHIVLSRGSSEGIIGLLCTLLGLSLCISGIAQHRFGRIIAGAGALLTSYLLYHPFRLLTPLLVLPLLWYPNMTSHTKMRMTGLTVALFLLSAAIGFTRSGGGRFFQVAFYQSPLVKSTTDRLEAGEGINHVLRARLFHNKAVIYGREFLQQYLGYFSPHYLFVWGGKPDRYVVPEQGLLYVIMIPFFLIGLLSVKSRKTWGMYYLFYLVLIAPLPAAFTHEDAPNIHRSLFMMVPFVLVAAFGWRECIAFIRARLFRRILGTVSAVLLCVEVIYFVHQYAIHSASHKSFLRNDMTKEMMEKVIALKPSFDTVVMPVYDELALYYLFYSRKFERFPTAFVKEKYEISAIDNVRFVGSSCPSKELSRWATDIKKVLVVDQGDCVIPVGFREIVVMMRHDSTRAFRLLYPETVLQTGTL